MGALVEDLLLLSSIDSKEMKPNMEQYNLSEIIKHIVDRLQIQAEEKKITLKCYSMTKLPRVFINRSSIERIFINIIGNAIKYTDQNGKITVYLGLLVDDVYVKVSDSGFGIEEDKIQHIFKRFYRVDMTGSRMYGGTGLGLSIAKELTELHGGEITVKSVLGKGTDFVVRIPYATKVFKNSIEYNTANYERGDILYRSANEYLIKTAKELGINTDSLSELSSDKKEDLIKKVVDVEDLN